MAATIRLAQITPALGDGGVETRVARILGGLDRATFELTWLGLRAPVNPALAERAGPNVEIVPIPRTRPGLDVKVLYELARHLIRRRVDVVHVHNWSTSVYGILAARIARARTVIYGVGGRESPEGPTRRRRLAMRALAGGIDVYTTVARSLAAEIADDFGLPAGRVIVIPTGVELERFRGDRAGARAALGVPSDAVVFGLVGTLRPVKRVDDLLRAAARAAEHLPKLVVVVIGWGHKEHVEPIEALRAELGLGDRCRFLGRREDAPELLPGLDVLVSSSDFEGSSNALIEAMAAGLPVIATRVGGSVELVREGVTGVLYSPRDVDALTRAMIELGRDAGRRREMGDAARAIADREHDLGKMVERYAELYRGAALR